MKDCYENRVSGRMDRSGGFLLEFDGITEAVVRQIVLLCIKRISSGLAETPRLVG